MLDGATTMRVIVHSPAVQEAQDRGLARIQVQQREGGRIPRLGAQVGQAWVVRAARVVELTARVIDLVLTGPRPWVPPMLVVGHSVLFLNGEDTWSVLVPVLVLVQAAMVQV